MFDQRMLTEYGNYSYDDCGSSLNNEKPSPGESAHEMRIKACPLITYHDANPRTPAIPSRTPAAIKPEKAPDSKLPWNKMASRTPNSFRVYQEER